MGSHVPASFAEMSLAAVVPCRDAADTIGPCIESLLARGVREIHVVDNGSIDGSAEIADRFGPPVTVHRAPELGSISEVRNAGVRATSTDWLAFIDSDVELDGDWGEGVVAAVKAARDEGIELERLVTGSTYVNPRDPNWVRRIWYDQLRARDAGGGDYINGGHLIVTRALFDEVGGFDPDYSTGEDVRFCRVAVAAGARVRRDPRLLAMHHGYPSTLAGFFRRERWHAEGMANEIGRFWRARDLMLGLANLVLPIAAVAIGALTGAWLPAAAGAVGLLLAPLALMALRRASRLADVPGLFVLYVVWGWAKTAGLLRIMRSRLTGKRPLHRTGIRRGPASRPSRRCR